MAQDLAAAVILPYDCFLSVTETTDFSDHYFDNMAALEDRHPWTRRMRAFTLTMLQKNCQQRPAAILDAGCGTGRFLTEWKRAMQAPVAVGVDLFPSALVFARQRAQEHWIAASAAALPFRSESFDMIHSADVLQHMSLQETEDALDLFRDLLRPAGHLALRVRAVRLLETVAQADYSHAFSRSSLRAALESRGFRIEFLSHTNALPSLWAEIAGKLRSNGQPPGKHEGMAVHGIQIRSGAELRSRLLEQYLKWEHACLLRAPFSLGFGHTIICLAQKCPSTLQ
jgi:ubiquinone/menaquinone biosynthesis C-methylase UbiE